MVFLPFKDETLVSPYDHQTIIHKMIKHINIDQDEHDKPFNGRVRADTFTICQKLRRPDNYIPLITGRIEQTSKGSLIFLKYRLMYSTKIFLVFWSILLIVLSLFFGLKYNAYTYASLALAIGVANYLIVYLNFKKKVDISHELLVKVLG